MLANSKTRRSLEKIKRTGNEEDFRRSNRIEKMKTMKRRNLKDFQKMLLFTKRIMFKESMLYMVNTHK
jgi:hypothetical protein